MITILVNGNTVELSTPATGAALLSQLNLADAPLVVEHNGSALTKSAFSSAELQAGDVVELVSIVGGG